MDLVHVKERRFWPLVRELRTHMRALGEGERLVFPSPVVAELGAQGLSVGTLRRAARQAAADLGRQPHTRLQVSGGLVELLAWLGDDLLDEEDEEKGAGA